MPKSAMALTLSAEDREQIGAWLRAPSTPQQVALRCRIALAAAQGQQDLEIAAQFKVNRHTPALWRKRVRGRRNRLCVGNCSGSGTQTAVGASQARRDH